MAESLSTTLLDAIDYGIKNRLSDAQFDKTVICTVDNMTDNWVTLSSSGNTFTVRLKNNFNIKRGDTVHLKFPSNNKNNKYLEEDLSSAGSSSGGSYNSAVTSVNGHTGDVVIEIADINGLAEALESGGGGNSTITTSWGYAPDDDVRGTWEIAEPAVMSAGAYWFEITDRKV